MDALIPLTPLDDTQALTLWLRALRQKNSRARILQGMTAKDLPARPESRRERADRVVAETQVAVGQGVRS